MTMILINRFLKSESITHRQILKKVRQKQRFKQNTFTRLELSVLTLSIYMKLFFWNCKPFDLQLGAVHILCQPKWGVHRPLSPPLSAMVSFWITPTPSSEMAIIWLSPTSLAFTWRTVCTFFLFFWRSLWMAHSFLFNLGRVGPEHWTVNTLEYDILIQWRYVVNYQTLLQIKMLWYTHEGFPRFVLNGKK